MTVDCSVLLNDIKLSKYNKNDSYIDGKLIRKWLFIINKY
jgi:hypothetical protein